MIEGIEYLITKNNSVANETHAKISLDKEDPTQAEIDAEVIRLQAEYDAQAYARNRSTEYPALAEQLDEIYHNGVASWKATIKVTKDKYPKG
jgi:hypothetical protein